MTKLKRLQEGCRVDLRMLADRLSLSQATVSRALSGHPAIKSATRERVASAARELGYSPNSKARGLATGRTEAIGLVFPLERLLLAQTNFVEVLSGISDVITRRNYALLMSPFSDDEEAVLRRLASSGTIGGLIITRPRVDDPRISLLHGLGIPFVVHGRSDVDIPYSYVDIDNRAVFEKSAGLLLDLGHRRIASLNADLKFRYAAARATGFEAAHRSRGLNPVPGLSVQTPMTEQSGYEQAIRLLSSAEPPTAILSGSIFMAQGVYRAIREKGLRPGRDVSVVAHDDQLRGIKANEFDPPLSATESSVRKAGERLAEILIDRVDTGAAEPVTEIWPVELIVRGSIAPPPRH